MSSMAPKMLPNREKISIVIAVITLTLGMTFLLPSALEQTNSQNWIWAERLMPLLVATLTYFGTVWIFSEDSGSQTNQQGGMLIHLILPVLSVYVLTVSLLQMERSATWWWIYFAGITLYAAVVLAEYQDFYYEGKHSPLAGILLVAVSHALFFILSAVFKLGVLRLILVIPGIFMAASFITLRMIKLRTDQVDWGWMFLMAIMVTQFAGGLFYLFLTPIQYALILTATLYCLISLAAGVIEKRKGRSLYLEPSLMILLTVVIFVFASIPR